MLGGLQRGYMGGAEGVLREFSGSTEGAKRGPHEGAQRESNPGPAVEQAVGLVQHLDDDGVGGQHPAVHELLDAPGGTHDDPRARFDRRQLRCVGRAAQK